MDALEAVLIESPATAYRRWKKEFLEKSNTSGRYYPKTKETPIEYNFKRRWLSARKIPPSFVQKDREGGYTVFSSNIKRRFFRYDRTRYHYHVYKTVFGYWTCTCQDFAFNCPKPCKHIIRTILYVYGDNQEHDTKFTRRIALCLSDDIREIDDVIAI